MAEARVIPATHSGEPKGEDTSREWTIYMCALDHASPSRNKGGRCATCGREVKEIEVVPASALAQALEENRRLREQLEGR